MKFNISQQIEEVDRELKYRRDVYARLVSSGKLKQSLADYQMDRMLAVKKTLEFVQANEQRIKDMLYEGT